MRCSLSGDPKGDTVDTVITLVHGTFAPHAPWTRENSKLCIHLQDHLPGAVRFHAFDWSGANTHKVRIEAGHALQNELRDRMEEHPQAVHVVIGHSHGGNIALYSVGGSDLDGKLAGIFCFNTPFVCATRRSHNQILFFLLHALALLLLFIGIGYPAICLSALILGEPISAQQSFVSLAIGAAFLFCANLVLRQRAPVAAWIARRQSKLISTIGLPTIKNTPVHCIWGPSDEVIGLFSFFDAISALPYILMHPISLALLSIVAFFLFGVWQETAFAWFGPDDLLSPSTLWDKISLGIIWFIARANDVLTGGGGHYRGGWLFFGVILAALAVVILILLSLAAALIAQTVMRLLPMGVSWNNVLDSLFVHLTFTQTPVNARRVVFSEVGTSVSLLMHSSIYADDQALEAILQGILAASRD